MGAVERSNDFGKTTKTEKLTKLIFTVYNYETQQKNMTGYVNALREDIVTGIIEVIIIYSPSTKPTNT